MDRPRFNGNGSSHSSSYRSSGGGGGSGGGGSFSFRGSSNGGRFGGGGGGGGGGRGRNSQVDDFDLPRPNWNELNLRPIEKNVYVEHPETANRPTFVINEYLNTNSIVVSGDRFVNPILTFNETSFPDIIMKLIRDQNFQNPTIIQSMCWPVLLSGNDIVGIAQTGSGKTLGFVLPLIIQILNQRRRLGRLPHGPIALILAPTRELALQIQAVAETFGKPVGISNMCLYGGASRGPQMGALRRGAEICIATPGRLLDFLKERSVQLTDCTNLVLDEADRMLDMGFEPQITKIIQQIRPDRQTAMFSATWPREVRRLAESFLATYIHVTIGQSELQANPNITQIIEVCDEREKETRIKRILDEIMVARDAKVIMFAETKRKVDDYSKIIRRLGFHCMAIHGDKKQSEREWVLNEFRHKPKSILVATDVAARGLNIEDIKYVINIDYPTQTEDYIHRIGRTARSTNTGIAYTLVTRDNAAKMPKLIEILRETNQEIPRPLLDLASMHKSGQFRNGGRPSRFSNNYNRFGNGGGGGASRDDGFRNGKRPASHMMSSNGGGYGGGDDDSSKRFRYNQPSSSDRGYGNGASNGSSHNLAAFASMLPNLPPPPPPSSSSSNGYGNGFRK